MQKNSRCLSLTVVLGGQLEILQWIYSPSDKHAIGRCAARAGKIEILEWLFSLDGNANMYDLASSAALGGQIPTLEWLLARGATFNEDTCFMAAQGGSDSTEIITWLQSHGCPWDERITSYYAAGGDYELLKWALENGCPRPKRGCYTGTGNLKILQLLREHGCQWDPDLAPSLACQKEWDILVWAVDNGCPMSATVSCIITRYRSLDFLKYLHERGCPLDKETIRTAVEVGDLPILKWAVELNCPCPPDIYETAARRGFKEIAEWIEARGLREYN